MKIITKWILATLSTVTLSFQVSAGQFDEIVIFGDSLSDSGAFVGTADAGVGGGKFTTNPGPVWTESLGELYGLSVTPNNPNNPNNPNTSASGNNYAQGGAQVTNPIGIGQGPSPQAALPISAQINNYLATNPVANSSGLYTLFGGANDIFFNVAQVSSGLPVLSAIDNLVTSAASLAGQAQQLGDAGAGTILVPNVPDIGTTPTSILQAISAVGAGNPNLANALGTATVILRTPANTPAEQEAVRNAAVVAAEEALNIPIVGFLQPAVDQTGALLTTLTDAYNLSLANFLSTSTANVIRLDLAGLFNDTLADPSAFGLSNVTGTACNTASSLSCTAATLAFPGADQSFLFADSVHPTSIGHSVIAGLAFDTLNAATSVPEPSVLFLLTPVLGMLVIRRKRSV